MAGLSQEKKKMMKVLEQVRTDDLPVKRSKILVSQNWKKHPNFRAPETQSIGYVGLDCEMVSTDHDPNTLARVSIVDIEGNILLDELWFLREISKTLGPQSQG